MERFVLTDAQWAKMEPHCLGKPTDPGRSGSDNRRFVEAVLWIARTGSGLWHVEYPISRRQIGDGLQVPNDDATLPERAGSETHERVMAESQLSPTP